MIQDAELMHTEQLDDAASRISNVCLPRVARWMEDTYGLETHEAKAVVARAFRRYGRAVAEAWRKRAVHVSLREHNRAFRFELSMSEPG